MNNPLVSIPIITYNSSKFILETLESAKAQTYQNIELLISDDCSTDNTVELCRTWLVSNKERFVRVELLTVEKNSGIAANLNRAYAACKGEWIKGLAGDDIFLPDCIENNINYIIEHTEAQIVFSNEVHFINTFNPNNILKYDNNRLRSFFSLNQEEQLKEFIIKGNYLPAPTVFLKKGLIESVGGYNNKYRFIEDAPMWLSLLENSVKFFYLDKDTIAYRYHSESLSTHTEKLYDRRLIKSAFMFKKEKLFRYYSRIRKTAEYFEYYFKLVFDYLGLNCNNLICKYIYVVIIKLTRLFR